MLLSASKLFTLAESVFSTNAADPVLVGLTARESQIVAATLEGTVGVAVLSNWFSPSAKGKLLLVLSWAFCSYRIVLYATGMRRPCACLDSLSVIFGLSPFHGEILGVFLLVVFLACGARLSAIKSCQLQNS